MGEHVSHCGALIISPAKLPHFEKSVPDYAAGDWLRRFPQIRLSLLPETLDSSFMALS